MAEEKQKLVNNWGPNEIWRIRKNVVVITVAFMFHYTAAHGFVSLQSSINAEAGLGTASLVTMFLGVFLSNIFFTSVIIKWLGTKATICFSFLTYMPFMALQLYPRFGTLIPAGLLMGLGCGTLLCAKCTYLAVLAEAQSIISKKTASTILLKFSGFFFMVYHLSVIWGNMISSLVLSSENKAAVTTVNETMIPQMCGTNFLPNMDASVALPKQPPEKITAMAGIFSSCIVGATIFVALTLDSMKRYEICRKPKDKSLSGFALLAVTMKQLGDTDQLLILTLNIFIGLQQSFFYGDFTASFVACAIGTGSVGFVMMSYGVSNVTGCCVTSYFGEWFGRVPLMCGALFIHGGLLLTMLVWYPEAGDYYQMIAFAVLWGICDSIWTVQINAYYGVLFRGREEAAFSNLGLWEGFGCIISFALSTYVRTRYKVYVLLCFLIVGFTGYSVVEYRQRVTPTRVINESVKEETSTNENDTRL